MNLPWKKRTYTYFVSATAKARTDDYFSALIDTENKITAKDFEELKETIARQNGVPSGIIFINSINFLH